MTLRRRPFLLVVLALAGCAKGRDEKNLREHLEMLQQALADGDADRFMTAISTDFVGPAGMDRDAVRESLRPWLQQEGGAQVSVHEVDLKVDGQEARVSFTARFGAAGGWLARRSPGWNVHSGWRLAPGGWQVLQASWEPAS